MSLGNSKWIKWLLRGSDAEVDIWYGGKPISRQMIAAYEKKIGYRFPKDFVKVAMLHNGGSPVRTVFDTARGEEEIAKLISFDKEDAISVWVEPDAFAYDLAGQNFTENYVRFAFDIADNYLCFARKDSSVVYVDQDSEEVLFVAPSFREFVTMLREDEE